MLDCVEQGYKVCANDGACSTWIVLTWLCDQVRACVRDLSKPDKVDHLYAMNYMGLKGSVELVEADLFDMGSYDAALEGCQCLIQ